MKQKLSSNNDCFDISQMRLVYVTSQCVEGVCKHITLHTRKDVVNPYTDLKDLLEHLQPIFTMIQTEYRS